MESNIQFTLQAKATTLYFLFPIVRGMANVIATLNAKTQEPHPVSLRIATKGFLIKL